MHETLNYHLERGLFVGLSTASAEPECECEPEHSITKLGHSRSCPWFGRSPMPTLPVEARRLHACGWQNHTDGTPHDFEWATYVDNHVSTGVCRCGADALSHAMRYGP